MVMMMRWRRRPHKCDVQPSRNRIIIEIMIFYSIKQLQTIVGFAIITDSDININANSRESNVYTYVRMCGKIV